MKKLQQHIYFCFIVTLLSSTPLLAKEISISVLQKGSGDKVEGATVAILETGEYDTTDDQGNVIFDDIEYPVKIKILNTGYETFETELKEATDKITFYIEPLAYEGESLDVVAERVQEKTSKLTLSREELRRAPGSQGDPLKVIQSMPGIVTAAEGAGVFYVRGSEPNQNIVWVNRARIGYLYHFGGLHSTISPQLIQDFNMFLGGFPVEYGDSLGGALDVKLRSPKNDRIHQHYSIGTFESSIVLEGPIGKAGSKDSFYVSARRSYIDLLFSPDTFSNLIDDDDDPEEEKNKVTEVPSFYDAQAVWQRELNNGRLMLQHFSAGDEIRLDLNSTSKSDPDVKGELANSVEYHSTSLVWEQQWSPTLNTSSSLYYINSLSSTKLGEDANGNPYFLKINDHNYVWQPEARWNINENLLLTTGTEFIYAETPVDASIGRQPGFNDIDYNLTETKKFNINSTYKTGLVNPYVKIRNTWKNKLTTQLGLRGTYVKSNGREDMKHLSPRFSAEYALNDKTTFTSSWGKYIQLPDGAFWIRDVGNPKLDFLSSEHRIVGVQHKVTSLWSTQFEIYHKPMKNLVVNYEELDTPNNYTNEGVGESYGFDLLIKRDFYQGKMGWLSYSYLESTRREKGETFPFLGDQRHTLTLVWSQPLKNDWKKWTLGFRLRANSGKPYTPVLGRDGRCISGEEFVSCVDQGNAENDPDFSHWRPKWGEINSARLPNYFQLDLRIDKETRFNTWKLNFYMDILNILNTENISGYDYGNAYEDIDSPEKQIALGLFPSFGVEASF